MKIRYRFVKETQYKNEQIIEKIISKLNEHGVDKIETKNNIISFKNNFWKIGSNIKYVTKVNKGYFEVINTGNNVKIKYTCYVSILGDILFLTLTGVLGIFVHGFFFFIGLMLLIQFISRTIKIKSLNNDLVEEITTMS